MNFLHLVIREARFSLPISLFIRLFASDIESELQNVVEIRIMLKFLKKFCIPPLFHIRIFRDFVQIYTVFNFVSL